MAAVAYVVGKTAKVEKKKIILSEISELKKADLFPIREEQN